ncbi:MAG: hypothetical protein BHV65_16025 [Alistipes sp. 58_9_plus]|nr:MAG: hypothetical protein BHV65_16025 [Alistipes sp. 58_9_plus]
MKISEIFTYFTDTIFRRDIREWRNPEIRWLVQQYRLLFYTARGLLEHGTIVRSAALTFYTLMSLVPIVAVVFAVVKGFGLGLYYVRTVAERHGGSARAESGGTGRGSKFFIIIPRYGRE